MLNRGSEDDVDREQLRRLNECGNLMHNAVACDKDMPSLEAVNLYENSFSMQETNKAVGDQQQAPSAPSSRFIDNEACASNSARPILGMSEVPHSPASMSIAPFR